MANTNPAFVMCPPGEYPSAYSTHLIACSSDGTYSGSPIYLGDAVSYGGTGDPEASFNDGLTLGWAVVAAMVAAYAIHLLRKALT